MGSGDRATGKPSIVALQHRVALLIGARGDGSAVTRIGICAFAARVRWPTRKKRPNRAVARRIDEMNLDDDPDQQQQTEQRARTRSTEL